MQNKIIADNADSVAARRLDLLNGMQSRLGALTDELADTESNLVVETCRREQLERLQVIGKEIKRERTLGRRGGRARWPVHVVLLICELLTVGIPPSAISGTLQVTHRAFKGCELRELPQPDFVRKCRTVLDNLNSMLAAKRLGEARTWHQLFTDGTTRRQIAFQNLVIGLVDSEDKFDSVIASSCIFVEDESSATQVEAIKSKVCTKSICIYCLNLKVTKTSISCFIFFCRL